MTLKIIFTWKLVAIHEQALGECEYSYHLLHQLARLNLDKFRGQ